MAGEKEWNQSLGKLEEEIPGFIAASLVDLDSGMTLAMRSTRGDFDLTVASAYNSEIVKQKQKIMKVLNLDMPLEDILLTLGAQIHLIKLVTPTTFLYLATSREGTNLAIVRSVVNRHAGGLV